MHTDVVRVKSLFYLFLSKQPKSEFCIFQVRVSICKAFVAFLFIRNEGAFERTFLLWCGTNCKSNQPSLCFHAFNSHCQNYCGDSVTFSVLHTDVSRWLLLAWAHTQDAGGSVLYSLLLLLQEGLALLNPMCWLLEIGPGSSCSLCTSALTSQLAAASPVPDARLCLLHLNCWGHSVQLPNIRKLMGKQLLKDLHSLWNFI